MLTVAALSILLAAAQPTPAPAESDAPVATQRSTPRVPPGPAIDVNNLPVPAGAPSDDFGLVAWCHGALRGHMELAKVVDEQDEELDTIGREYLKTYEQALAAAPQGRTPDGEKVATAAREAGYGSWSAARGSGNKETQRYTYLGWQLPGRCEHAAKRLTGGPGPSAALAPPSVVSEPPLPTGDSRTTP